MFLLHENWANAITDDTIVCKDGSKAESDRKGAIEKCILEMKQKETSSWERRCTLPSFWWCEKANVSVDTDAYARDDGGAIIIKTSINNVSGQDGSLVEK
jgi:hypothetical protein